MCDDHDLLLVLLSVTILLTLITNSLWYSIGCDCNNDVDDDHDFTIVTVMKESQPHRLCHWGAQIHSANNHETLITVLLMMIIEALMIDLQSPQHLPLAAQNHSFITMITVYDVWLW